MAWVTRFVKAVWVVAEVEEEWESRVERPFVRTYLSRSIWVLLV